jgi:hypothetical protein
VWYPVKDLHFVETRTQIKGKMPKPAREEMEQAFGFI